MTGKAGRRIDEAAGFIGITTLRKTANLTKRSPTNGLYRGGKISEYQFRRVLRAFAADRTASDLAREMTLSLNSIVAIYQRLRAHYVRIGVFRDFYRDDYPNGCTNEDMREAFEAFEFGLLGFHMKRMSRMRGVKLGTVGADHHFPESCWRFRYAPFFEGRPSEPVHEMMFSELLAYIKAGGPVGANVPNLRAVRTCEIEHLNRKADWLGRNSETFKADCFRARLKAVRAL